MLDKSPGRPRASRSPLFWIIYLHFLLLCRNITALSAHQSGRIVKWRRSAKSPNNGLVYPCLTGQSLSILKSAERAREWDVISSRLLQHRHDEYSKRPPSRWGWQPALLSLVVQTMRNYLHCCFSFLLHFRLFEWRKAWMLFFVYMCVSQFLCAACDIRLELRVWKEFTFILQDVC